MRVFISYSSAYHDTAESVAIRLREDGHEVFFDRHSLQSAQEFDAGIRREIRRADLFILLITPEAVRDGAYTRTELDLVQRQWPKPSGRLLPVMLAPTPISDVPPYARAVTVLQTKGNLVAEVAARVAEMAAERRGKRSRYLLLAVACMALLGTAGYQLIAHYLSGERGDDEVQTCYLAVRLQLDGSTPAAYTLRVGGGGISRDFSTAAGGTANIHVTGRQITQWELTVIDRDGQTLGTIPLSGCPGSDSVHALNGRAQLHLGPRDVLP